MESHCFSIRSVANKDFAIARNVQDRFLDHLWQHLAGNNQPMNREKRRGRTTFFLRKVGA